MKEEEKKKSDKKSDDKRYRRGIKIGGAAMGAGALASGIGAGSKLWGPPGEKSDSNGTILLATGIPLALAGGALTGYSAYKHHKYKKNKEEKKDDNSKK